MRTLREELSAGPRVAQAEPSQSFLQLSMRVPESPPFSDSGGVLAEFSLLASGPPLEQPKERT
jgi:hypothetical protein